MFIIDTNILSELVRPNPDSNVVSWLHQQPLNLLFTTAITKAELYYGTNIMPVGQRRDELRKAIDTILHTGFQNRILEFNSNSAMHFAEVASVRKKAGQPISTADAQIAAICREYSYTLVTRNTSEFNQCDIKLINPFFGQSS